MTASELKEKIKRLAIKVYQEKTKGEDAAIAYDELVKFPELKAVIIDLLTADFDSFLESVDWVSPRPSAFRINLLNGQNFMLTFDPRSWIAQVEGKKYYLLNLDEEEMAAKAVSRILAYGPASGATVEGDNDTVETEEEIEVDEE
ncbi:hypothetical protein N8579_00190 [bacterium]|jgi:hypothetical protein|nr:hypothetical protein [bacterium]